MTDCPWCGNEFENVENICPYCKHEVLPEHIERHNSSAAETDNEEVKLGIAESVPEQEETWQEQLAHNDIDAELIVITRFECAKCGHDHCLTELADESAHFHNNGQYSYIYASCQKCGYVETYNADIVRKSAAKLRHVRLEE